MTIDFFQKGGRSLSVGLDYTPVAATRPAQAGTVAKEEKKDNDLATKDILNMVKDIGGLKNDTDRITTMISNFFLDQGSIFNQLTPHRAAAKLAMIMGEINKAKWSRDQFESAQTSLRANEGLEEYAIDSNGLVLCMKNDYSGFERLTPEAAMKSTTSTPITNMELLQMRDTVPGLETRDDLTYVAQSGVGMKSIDDMVKNVISGMGTTELQKQGYSLKTAEAITEGTVLLQQAAALLPDQYITDTMTVQGLYQNKVITKSQAEQMSAALGYIMATLPKNMKSLLMMKAGRLGLGADESGALQVLSNLVMSKTSTMKAWETKREDTPKEVSDAQMATTGVLNYEDMSPLERLMMGYAEMTDFAIQTGTSAAIAAKGYTAAIPMEGGKMPGICTLDEFLTNSLGGSVDVSSMSFGGQRVSSVNAKQVVVNGNNVYMMAVPVDQEAKIKGYKIPDYALLQKLEEANEDLRVNYHINAMNPQARKANVQTINKVYAKHQLPKLLTDEGELSLSSYETFIVVDAETPGSALQMMSDNVMAREVTRKEKGQRGGYNMTIDPKTPSLKKREAYYAGTLFLPVSQSLQRASMASNKKIDGNVARTLSEKEESAKRLNNSFNNGQEKYKE